jgi:hypothetical protein
VWDRLVSGLDGGVDGHVCLVLVGGVVDHICLVLWSQYLATWPVGGPAQARGKHRKALYLVVLSVDVVEYVHLISKSTGEGIPSRCACWWCRQPRLSRLEVSVGRHAHLIVLVGGVVEHDRLILR